MCSQPPRGLKSIGVGTVTKEISRINNSWLQNKDLFYKFQENISTGFFTDTISLFMKNAFSEIGDK